MHDFCSVNFVSFIRRGAGYGSCLKLVDGWVVGAVQQYSTGSRVMWLSGENSDVITNRSMLDEMNWFMGSLGIFIGDRFAI